MDEGMRIAEDEELLHKVGSILDHPSLYIGGPSRQSMQKARAILAVITDAMAADKAEIARLREALRDMADVVAVYAAQPLAPTRQRDRFHQDQWDQLRQGTAEMLAAALEKTDV